jgi:[acyl-carrier-protein] S-malonyltransferase
MKSQSPSRKQKRVKVGERTKVAFVFPGQGSQYVGMGKDFYEQFDIARRVFMEAEEASGLPLTRLCFSGPEKELKLTEHTQPAILTASIAALRVMESEFGLKPLCVAGHSLGEYSALVSVGALAFTDAVRVVRERGRLMQEAVPPGKGLMAVILGLEADEVRSICEEAGRGQVVAPANLNGAGQIVIAGERDAVLRAMSLASERGAKKVLELPVSAPFHCSLMLSAAEGLKKVLSDVQVHPFSTGVVTNVQATINLDSSRVKSLLVEQAIQPVRWEESVKQLESLGCERVVEVGPGKVLSGLIKRITSKLRTVNFGACQDLERLSIG